MFKKIVLATDGSAHAMKSAEVAADLAATYGARLTIVNVLPTTLSLEEVEKTPQAKKFSRAVKREIAAIRNTLVRSPTHDAEALYQWVPALQTVRKELAGRILDDAERIARAKKVKTVVRVAVDGDPAERIAETVKKSQADLVVMGARGLGSFGALIFGSVSRKVTGAVKCPALIVR